MQLGYVASSQTSQMQNLDTDEGDTMSRGRKRSGKSDSDEKSSQELCTHSPVRRAKRKVNIAPPVYMFCMLQASAKSSRTW